MTYNTNVLYITRFIASALIVILHFAPDNFWGSYHEIFKNSGEGVNYFFFISGFVMIIANKSFINTNSKQNLLPKNNFWIKRVARIFPLYVFAFLLVLIFHFFVAPVESSVLLKTPFELLAVQRWFYVGSINFPGWSISCELLFYLIFPFLITFINTNYRKYTYSVLLFFFVTIIVNCMLFFAGQIKHNHQIETVIKTLYLHPIFKLPIFMLGTLCGIAYINKTFKFFDSKPNVVFSTVLSLLIICFVFYIFPKDFYLIEIGLLSIIYFILILSICNLNGKETLLFNSKYSMFLGDISYGIYILQYPVYLFYKYYISNINTTIQFAFFAATLITISAITFYFFEIPFKNLILNFYHNHKKNKSIEN